MNQELAGRMPGKRVRHCLWGKGTVTFCTNVAVKVRFDESGRETAFGFPYGFKQFLTAEDPELQKEIVAFYDTGDWCKPIHNHNG